MKISSKSILSPNRPTYSREPPPPPPPIALSTSLNRTRSRRLTNSRSIKGAASPAMFPVVTGKKRGSGFDNPEPSSPKVTCIGQVRVKTKMKHAKNIRSLSRRRKLEHSRSLRKNSNSNIYNNNNNNNTNSNNNNNRQWVHHIPLTICETLRTFGSEVSCLFPCRSPCLSTENNEERKHEWVVALKDEEEEMEVGNNVRRHVFDGLEIVNDVVIGSRDEGRVSICVPPKNALLLMRCRSDPEMMEALTNRVWEPMLEINEEKDGEICEEGLQMEGEKLMVLDDVDVNDEDIEEIIMDDVNVNDEDMEDIILEMEMKQTMQDEEEEDDEDQEQRMETNEEEEDSFFLGFLFEENLNEKEIDKRDAEEELFEDKGEDVEEEESNIEKVKHVEESSEISVIQEEVNEESETRESNVEKVKQIEEEIEDMLTEFNERSEIPEETCEVIEVGESNIEKVKEFEERNEQMLTEFTESPEKSYEELFEDEDVQETETGESNIEQFEDEDEDEDETETGESNVVNAKQSEEEFEEMLTEFTEEIEVENGGNEEREKIEALPECLLLMMYEPKLSMEVSKETWVRSSDFIRRHSSKKKPPPPPPLPTEPIDNNVTNMVAVQYEPVAQQQPARSSCSFPAAPRSIIAVLEEKLVMGFEPLALSRCKSEPMRRARESCSWQNQLEPPRRASFGVGMAGLG